MAINRLTATLATGINENTLALANMNLDLSLFRVEAPTEYSSLGAALTAKRRFAAEEGIAHQTARRLGVLFQEILPSTPELLRAYGRRASEISQKSPNTEEGRGKHGVFAGFLGADGTSIWAAATSGASSIAVHFLACLLARLWSGPEATSIWVEIVAERKRMIQERARDGVYNTSMELSIISSQDITRNDLAQWDASARAWLQVGDDAFMRQQKQLMLIVNNVHLPVNTGKNTFDRVIDAWVTAMNAMEKLIQGQPQRAANGAALMGIASWHLYPDLLVLGETISSVKFHDTAIPGSAQLTVGLENLNAEDQDGIYWSLSLSHMRFYGDPVVAKTYTSRDASRLSMDELHLLALGATLASWGEVGLDTHAGARSFRAVGNACVDLFKNPRLTWLEGLHRVSETFLQFIDEDRHNALAIIGLGRRRGRQLLADKQNYPPPTLGLNHPFIDSLLSDTTQDRLVHKDLYMLHFIASHLGLRPDQLIIRIKRSFTPEGEDEIPRTTDHHYEYRTVTPHVDCVYEEMKSSHIRWIESKTVEAEVDVLLGRSEVSSGCKCHSRFYDCHHSACVCMQKGLTCTPYCHKLVDSGSKDVKCPGCQRQDAVTRESIRKEGVALQCENMPKSEITHRPKKGIFYKLPLEVVQGLPDWNFGITRITRDFPTAPMLAISHNPAKGPLCTCYRSTPTFTLLAGDPNNVAMFIRVDSGVRMNRHKLSQNLAAAANMPMIPLNTVIQRLESSAIDPRLLTKYLESYEMPGINSLPSFSKHLHPHTINVKPFIRSLNALALATNIYRDFPSATTSLSVIQHSLHKAHWVPKDDSFWSRTHRALKRQQCFACIAFFESGSYDLRPSDLTEVIALSLRNGIYVSSTLLGDPYELSHKDRVTLVVGNVGKTGIVMMVAPLAPRIKPVDVNEWRQIAHAPFRGEAEDCFRATSLHLSFTEFEMPFAVGQRGAIDNDIAIVETIISIHDRGRWVGDIDVLSLYENSSTRNRHLQRFDGFDRHVDGELRCIHRKDFDPPRRLTALDNWEEIRELPEDLHKEHFGVVRAQKNWLARLSAACIAIQMNVRAVILPNEPVCWTCCCLQQWNWSADKGDNPVVTDSSHPSWQNEYLSSGGRAVEKARSKVPTLDSVIVDESGNISDSSVRTVKHCGPYDPDSIPQLFIY